MVASDEGGCVAVLYAVIVPQARQLMFKHGIWSICILTMLDGLVTRILAAQRLYTLKHHLCFQPITFA